jgi:hypothetical protein
MRKSYVRPVQHSLPLLAQMRSGDGARQCLMFGVDRTYRGHHETDAFDPGCVKTASMIRFSSDLAGGLDGAFCGWR